MPTLLSYYQTARLRHKYGEIEAPDFSRKEPSVLTDLFVDIASLLIELYLQKDAYCQTKEIKHILRSNKKEKMAFFLKNTISIQFQTATIRISKTKLYLRGP